MPAGGLKPTIPSYVDKAAACGIGRLSLKRCVTPIGEENFSECIYIVEFTSQTEHVRLSSRKRNVLPNHYPY